MCRCRGRFVGRRCNRRFAAARLGEHRRGVHFLGDAFVPSRGSLMGIPRALTSLAQTHRRSPRSTLTLASKAMPAPLIQLRTIIEIQLLPQLPLGDESHAALEVDAAAVASRSARPSLVHRQHPQRHHHPSPNGPPGGPRPQRASSSAKTRGQLSFCGRATPKNPNRRCTARSILFDSMRV